MASCLKSVLVLMGVVAMTWGHGMFRGRIPNGWNVPSPCGDRTWEAVGHMGPDYVPDKNVFGRAFVGNNRQWNRGICQQDSDGDGLTNGEELGDPNCRWQPGQRPEAQPRGHPGICEPDRPRCRSRSSYSQCPHRGGGGQGAGQDRRGQGAGPVRRLPVGANDHPQNFLSKQMAGLVPQQSTSGGSRGSMSVSVPDFSSQDFSSQGGRQVGRVGGQQGFMTQGGMRMPGPSVGGGRSTGFQQQDMPSLDVFSQNLDQRSIQGRGRMFGMGGMGGPGPMMGGSPSFGGMSGGMSGGADPSLTSQVQLRMQQERMRSMPGGGGGMMMSFGGDGRSSFGTSGTFSPMSPMGGFMSRPGSGGMMMSSGMPGMSGMSGGMSGMSGMPMGYPF